MTGISARPAGSYQIKLHGCPCRRKGDKMAISVATGSLLAWYKTPKIGFRRPGCEDRLPRRLVRLADRDLHPERFGKTKKTLWFMLRERK
jgi:hypothetical protein